MDCRWVRETEGWMNGRREEGREGGAPHTSHKKKRWEGRWRNREAWMEESRDPKKKKERARRGQKAEERRWEKEIWGRMKEAIHGFRSEWKECCYVSTATTQWDNAVLKGEERSRQKKMKSSEKGRTRTARAAINPHLPKILVSPLTLASTHCLIDCKADRYFESATVTASQVARESIWGGRVYTLNRIFLTNTFSWGNGSSLFTEEQ